MTPDQARFTARQLADIVEDVVSRRDRRLFYTWILFVVSIGLVVGFEEYRVRGESSHADRQIAAAERRAAMSIVATGRLVIFNGCVDDQYLRIQRREDTREGLRSLSEPDVRRSFGPDLLARTRVRLERRLKELEGPDRAHIVSFCRHRARVFKATPPG